MGLSLGDVALLGAGPAGKVGFAAKKAKEHIDDAGKDMPGYDAPELDSTTKEMMDAQVSRANMSDREMLAEKMAGVDANRGMISGAGVAQQNRALGMAPDTAMDQALSKRANQYFDRGQSQVRGKAEAGLSGERFNRRQTALQNKMTLDAQEAQIRQRKAQHQANVKAAKNQAVADVLGIGGTAVGAGVGAVAGGPQGAMTGAKIGGSASAFAGNTEMKGMGNG